MILAGGMGTRMKSNLPKVLHRAGGLPLIEHVVNTAQEITVAERITVVVGSQAERVRDALAHRGVQFAYQAEQLGQVMPLASARTSCIPDQVMSW